MLALLTFLAPALAAELSDPGWSGERARPVALVVATPGVDTGAYLPLITTLENHGLDARLLSFPPGQQDAASAITAEIPRGLKETGAQVLVGPGLGGTLAASSVAGGHAEPTALALLGAPLRFLPGALNSWLAAQPVPAEGLTAAAATDGSWSGRPVLPLLLGASPPSLTDLDAGWLGTLAGWVRAEHAVSLDGAVPVWAGSAGLDILAPPETVRPQVPTESFHRFGYLGLDPREYDHAALLQAPRALRSLAGWVTDTLGITPQVLP